MGDVIRVLIRRWFVLGVGLLAIGYLGWFVVTHVGTDYQASGQMVLLLPPEASGVTTPMNPYLNLPGGVSTVGALAAGHVMTHDAELALAAHGFTAEYDVALSPGTGPLLVITTKAKDPAQALATRDAVMQEIARTVGTLQQDVSIPTRQVISTQQSNVSSQAEVLPGSRLRALVGTVGAAMLVLLVVVFALDRAVAAKASQDRTRRTRRLRSRNRADEDTPVVDGDVDVDVDGDGDVDGDVDVDGDGDGSGDGDADPRPDRDRVMVG